MTFKVALVCIAKNEDHYIEEWVLYHLKLGVDHVFIYQNNWECNFRHSDVTIIDWPGENQQNHAYNNFIATYKDTYDWAAIIDVDEFIVLHKHATLKEFIADYQQFPSVGINWYLFGDNNQPAPTTNYSVLERFTRRCATPDQYVKNIVNLKETSAIVDAHYPAVWYDTNGKRNQMSIHPNGPTDVAQINHYFTKTISEFKLKIQRGRPDISTNRSLQEFFRPPDTGHPPLGTFNEVEDLTALNFYRTP